MFVFFHHIISKLVADFALIKISLQDDCKMLAFLRYFPSFTITIQP